MERTKRTAKNTQTKRRKSEKVSKSPKNGLLTGRYGHPEFDYERYFVELLNWDRTMLSEFYEIVEKRFTRVNTSVS